MKKLLGIIMIGAVVVAMVFNFNAVNELSKNSNQEIASLISMSNARAGGEGGTDNEKDHKATVNCGGQSHTCIGCIAGSTDCNPDCACN